MIRGLSTTIVCACLAGVVGIGLFFVKHDVKEQEARLAELNQEIQANQEAIHVLKAEWSYLNDPTRLRGLSEKFLSMKVMGPSQIATLDSLPGGNGPAYAAAQGKTLAKPAAPQTKVAVVPVPQPRPLPAAPNAPSRSIVIQSPALASTPALPGEIR